MAQQKTTGLILYGKAEVLELVNQREGEIKLGERVQTITDLDGLTHSTAQFVLLGIPEDIGVRANHGIAGAATAWEPALKALLNVQSNALLNGSEILLLGHFYFKEPDENTGSPAANLAALQQAVSEIDEQVYPVIRAIVEAGKIPIVVGGGHNNAFPILKGLSLGLNRPVNVVNIDAHADLRPPEGRHSGNGFSHAITSGYLRHYGIFGLHKNYNNQTILNTIAENPDIHAVFFDDLIKKGAQTGLPLLSSFEQLMTILDNNENTEIKPGLEIDLDCLENTLSSAFTPSGFKINDIRSILLSSTKKFAYLHVCEGAFKMANGRESAGIAKTIAYFITDFIRSQS